MSRPKWQIMHSDPDLKALLVQPADDSDLSGMDRLIAYVRGKSNSTGNTIETLYHLFDSTVEAIEFKVDGASDVTNIPIMNLDIKNDLLICFINRNGTIIIPNGKDVIKAGDSVMIVTKHSGFNCLNDILNT